MNREDGRNRFARGTGSQRSAVTISEAATSLFEELDRLGARDVVVSSNLQRRLDGGILASQSNADDPGVAVYFTLKGAPYVMARDQFYRAADNLRSLALAIEGLRQIERHGGSYMMKRAFSGFTALPPPDAPIEMPGPGALPRPWHNILGVAEDAPWSEVRTAYRERMREATDAEKVSINLAYDQAKKRHES